MRGEWYAAPAVVSCHSYRRCAHYGSERPTLRIAHHRCSFAFFEKTQNMWVQAHSALDMYATYTAIAADVDSTTAGRQLASTAKPA